VSPVGKPRRSEDVSTERFVVLLTPSERRQLFEAAKRRKRSAGELVREGLVKIGVLKP